MLLETWKGLVRDRWCIVIVEVKDTLNASLDEGCIGIWIGDVFKVSLAGGLLFSEDAPS